MRNTYEIKKNTLDEAKIKFLNSNKIREIKKKNALIGNFIFIFLLIIFTLKKFNRFVFLGYDENTLKIIFIIIFIILIIIVNFIADKLFKFHLKKVLNRYKLNDKHIVDISENNINYKQFRDNKLVFKLDNVYSRKIEIINIENMILIMFLNKNNLPDFILVPEEKIKK